MATAPNSDFYLYKTADTIKSYPLAMSLLRLLLKQGTASGWNLAEEIPSASPSTVLDALEMLKAEGAVDAQGTDLSAFYYVTSKGRQLRQFLSV
jgi:hypothetical protein